MKGFNFGKLDFFDAILTCLAKAYPSRSAQMTQSDHYGKVLSRNDSGKMLYSAENLEL
jgi:hypothetical protein